MGREEVKGEQGGGLARGGRKGMDKEEVGREEVEKDELKREKVDNDMAGMKERKDVIRFYVEEKHVKTEEANRERRKREKLWIGRRRIRRRGRG